MAARPRDRRRRDWPTGLREPRAGYYTWRNPATGQEMAIGRVPLAQAKQEAMAANEHVLALKPTLLERLTGSANTMAELLEKMPAAAKDNTARSRKSLDKKIREALGALPCHALTVKHCADLIESEIDGGKDRSSQALRSRLVAVCRRGMQLGWLEFNPAEPTQTLEVKPKRARLTIEQFRAIHAKAPEVNEWLAGAMTLALVTGLDRSTIAGLRRSAIGTEYLTVNRGKTGVWIEIPLALRLDEIGLTLLDALAACSSSVRSIKFDFVVHHGREFGNAPRGSGVHPDRMSHAFADARALAGIGGDHPPTFHEIRSLSKRLYEKQGNVDTKALLGHKDQKTADLYANPRGFEAIRVAYTPTRKEEDGEKKRS